MIAVFDTNVILDVLLARTEHFATSAAAIAEVELGRCHGLICADAMTTIHYIARRQVGTEESMKKLRDILKIFGVSPVTGASIGKALDSNFNDFEDAVVYESARSAGADCIVTRNVDDFRQASITIYTPGQFLTAIR